MEIVVLLRSYLTEGGIRALCLGRPQFETVLVV